MDTPSDLYENIALYLDEETFIHFAQINNIHFSFDFWIEKFRHDDMPFLKHTLPITHQQWLKEYSKLHHIKNQVYKTIQDFRAHGNRFIHFKYDPKRHQSEYQSLLTMLEGSRIQRGTDGSIYLQDVDIGSQTAFNNLVKIYYFTPKIYKDGAKPKGTKLYS